MENHPSFPPQENKQEEVLEGRKGDRWVSCQGQEGREDHLQGPVKGGVGSGWLDDLDPPMSRVCV